MTEFERRRRGVLRTRVGRVSVRVSRIEGGDAPPSLVTIVDDDSYVDPVVSPATPVFVLYQALCLADAKDSGLTINS